MKNLLKYFDEDAVVQSKVADLGKMSPKQREKLGAALAAHNSNNPTDAVLSSIIGAAMAQGIGKSQLEGEKKDG